MEHVVFKTMTTLDIRAITTFGLNAKPNTKSPIGYFGTGLKMAIAVLLRHNITIRLFIGQTEYEFYRKAEDFRGTEYSQVMMKKRGWGINKWFATALPFTTELAKNWTLWQAYRELESNTRDEGGTTQLEFLKDLGVDVVGQANTTTFIIGPSAEFAEVYSKRDEYFLPEAVREWAYSDANIQLFRRPSNAVYYRGIRIFDLKKPSLFTYNVLKPIELTEDRTAKYEWALKGVVQDYLAQQDDRGLINYLLNATDDHWESTLDWDDDWATAPSATFKDVLATRKARDQRRVGSVHVPMMGRFTAYHDKHTPKPPEPAEEPLHTKFKTWFSERINSVLTQEEVDDFEDLVELLRRKES